MLDILVITRVCADDFDIFKIWYEYYSRNFKNIACCLFKRPSENVDSIEEFLKENNVFYIKHENGFFDNPTTLATLKEIVDLKKPDIIVHLDSDEFVEDLYYLEEICATVFETGVAGMLEMQDRLSSEKKFYDISSCKSYEDLCSLAPNRYNITGEIQKWETQKCCVNVFPRIGQIHFSDPGIKTVLFSASKIQHFKWRSNWLYKAKRRYMETTILGYSWAGGIKKAMNYFKNA